MANRLCGRFFCVPIHSRQPSADVHDAEIVDVALKVERETETENIQKLKVKKN